MYLHALINRYNSMQSGIIENISWLKIKMRIKPEYNIQYNRKKTNNLSYFIDVEFFSEIFYVLYGFCNSWKKFVCFVELMGDNYMA